MDVPDERAPDLAAATSSPGPRGGRWQLLAFRIFFVYCAAYMAPFPVYWLGSAYQRLWDPVVPWVGERVLGFRSVDWTAASNGSGDTAFSYAHAFAMAMVALIVGAAWSIADRRSTDHPRLRGLLRVWVRYYLLFTMVIYGFAKVDRGQFPPPDEWRLAERFGDASPMGLLWTFMGYSAAYTILGGAVELLGGLLLLFRRTTLLGALVCATVLTNIVALNLSYDVPVKLYSMHLLGLSLFLVSADLGPLVSLLVLGRAGGAPRVEPWITRAWLARTVLALKLAVVLAAVAYSGREVGTQIRRARLEARGAALWGGYEVESFDIKTRADLEPSACDHWRSLRASGTVLTVTTACGPRAFEEVSRDASSPREEISYRSADTGDILVLTLEPRDNFSGVVFVRGRLAGRPFEAQIRQLALYRGLLMSRRFQWVSPAPFNR